MVPTMFVFVEGPLRTFSVPVLTTKSWLYFSRTDSGRSGTAGVGSCWLEGTVGPASVEPGTGSVGSVGTDSRLVDSDGFVAGASVLPFVSMLLVVGSGFSGKMMPRIQRM